MPIDLTKDERGGYCIDCQDSSLLLSAIYNNSRIQPGEDLGEVTTLFNSLGISVTFDGVDKTPEVVEV